jgi:hypothetical protein
MRSTSWRKKTDIAVMLTSFKGGTELCLSMCGSIVEEHNGKLHFRTLCYSRYINGRGAFTRLSFGGCQVEYAGNGAWYLFRQVGNEQ